MGLKGIIKKAATTLTHLHGPMGLAKFVEDTELYPTLKIPKEDHVVIAVIPGYGNENPEIHERKRDNLFFIDLRKHLK